MLRKVRHICHLPRETMSENNNDKYEISFEHLPVEIVLQIFAYFPFSDLMKTFFGLNTSIDSIIYSMSNLSEVVRFYDTESIRLLYSFANHIIRLVINDPSIDLKPFHNLRSLTLKYGSQTQFDSIRPEHHPLLQILRIKGNPLNHEPHLSSILKRLVIFFCYAGLDKSITEIPKVMNDLLEVLFSDRFSRLRTFITFGTGDVSFNNRWIGSSTLRTLILHRYVHDDTTHFYFICPRLRRLDQYLTWVKSRSPSKFF